MQPKATKCNPKQPNAAQWTPMQPKDLQKDQKDNQNSNLQFQMSQTLGFCLRLVCLTCSKVDYNINQENGIRKAIKGHPTR